ncbi:MAG: hypothetical protein E7547_05140 [Ruminococcaceae bacterium]|nr:hypothetical protein [Oscillospiraceae bacterium]
MKKKIKRYISTLKYLRVSQAVNRVLNKFKSKERGSAESMPVKFRNVNIMIPAVDIDEGFCRRYNIDELINGEISILNKKFKIDYSSNSRKVMAPLYRFNLYYFEYAVVLGAEYSKTKNVEILNVFKRLYEDYLKEKPALHPYVISLHLPNILIAMEFFGNALDEDFRNKVYTELFIQYKYLLSHFEKHLLANHYFENLKAAVIASYFFGDDKVCRKSVKLLHSQVKEQILPDGVHFELSPMYHKIILEDLLRIAKLSQSEGFPECDWIKPVIQNMLDAMASMEKGFSRTPLFNDSGNNVAKSAQSIEIACKDVLGIFPRYKEELVSSGYYKFYNGKIAMMFDAGKIGPDYNPGHGHCDCLSFEVCVDGKPLFVNSGTYEYQGDMRKYFRSTRAHNTLTVGSREQSECWGEHRVGNRIKNIKVTKKGSCIDSEYKNCFGDKHMRTVLLENGILTVEDLVVSPLNETVHSYLHLADGYTCKADKESITVYENTGTEVCKIFCTDCKSEIHTSGELCSYAPDFGVLKNSECVEFTWKNDDKKHGYKINFTE